MRKKFLLFIFLMGSLSAVSGCVTVITYTHERVDLETKGNKGYLVGDVPQGESSSEKSDRKTLQFNITLPGVAKGNSSALESERTQTQEETPAIQKENIPAASNPQQPEPEKAESTDDTIK